MIPALSPSPASVNAALTTARTIASRASTEITVPQSTINPLVTAYILYFIILGVSAGYTIKLVSIQKGLGRYMTSPPPNYSKSVRFAQDAGEALAITYTVIAFGILVLIIFKKSELNKISSSLIAFLMFANFVLQIVSFGALNQSPEYKEAREIMGSNHLKIYQAFNSIGFISSLILLGINGLNAYQSPAAVPPAAAGSPVAAQPAVAGQPAVSTTST